MKNKLKISTFLLCIIITLVYPFVHWHAHEHHDGIELQLSIHPPEFMEISNHQNHTESHEHNIVHFDVDWDYTFQINTVNTLIATHSQYNIYEIILEPQVIIRKPLAIPLKFPSNYLRVVSPDRAPPALV
jgi:hypothetical protein